MSTYNHAANVDRFYLELVGGTISGVTARPALTRDVHDLYRQWCDHRGLPSLATPAPFARLLQDRHSVPLLRKRYAIGDEILGPHGVLYLVAPPAPRVGFEPDWLGEHLTSFRAEAATFRAATAAVEHA